MNAVVLSLSRRHCFVLVLSYLWLLTPSALSSDMVWDLGEGSDGDSPFVAKHSVDTYSLCFTICEFLP